MASLSESTARPPGRRLLAVLPALALILLVAGVWALMLLGNTPRSTATVGAGAAPGSTMSQPTAR